jgi:hypothetical protein
MDPHQMPAPTLDIFARSPSNHTRFAQALSHAMAMFCPCAFGISRMRHLKGDRHFSQLEFKVK